MPKKAAHRLSGWQKKLAEKLTQPIETPTVMSQDPFEEIHRSPSD